MLCASDILCAWLFSVFGVQHTNSYLSNTLTQSNPRKWSLNNFLGMLQTFLFWMKSIRKKAIFRLIEDTLQMGRLENQLFIWFVWKIQITIINRYVITFDGIFICAVKISLLSAIITVEWISIASRFSPLALFNFVSIVTIIWQL